MDKQDWPACFAKRDVRVWQKCAVRKSDRHRVSITHSPDMRQDPGRLVFVPSNLPPMVRVRVREVVETAGRILFNEVGESFQLVPVIREHRIRISIERFPENVDQREPPFPVGEGEPEVVLY